MKAFILLAALLFATVCDAKLPQVNPFCIAAADLFRSEERPSFSQEELSAVLYQMFNQVNDPTQDLADVPRRISFSSSASPKNDQVAAAAIYEIIADLNSARPTRHVLWYSGQEAIDTFYARYKELSHFISQSQESFSPELWERVLRGLIGKAGALWSAKKSMLLGGTTLSAGLLSHFQLGLNETVEIGAILVGMMQSGIGALVTYGPSKGANAWSVISNAVLTQHDRPIYPDYSPTEVAKFFKPGDWNFSRILFTEPSDALGKRQSAELVKDAPKGVTAQDIRRYALSGRPEFMAITSQAAVKTVIESIHMVDQDGKQHFLLFVKNL
jgi:hypothetical protein